MPTTSWVIRIRATREVLFETFNPKIPKALNTKKYEAVPIGKYLASLNNRQRRGAPEKLTMKRRV